MNHRRGAIVALVAGLAISAILFSCRSRREGEQQTRDRLPDSEPVIRVYLSHASGSEDLRVAVRGPCAVRGLPSRRLLASPTVVPLGAVKSSPGGIRVGNLAEWPTAKVAIAPGANGTFILNGRTYSGTLELHRADSGAVVAINALPLEEYLCGVLGSEVLLSWPSAALQAQAIASRTYALHQMARKARKQAHVNSDTSDQNYRGTEMATNRARTVIGQTRGVVLTWESSLLPAYYSAICGGHTADALKGLDKPMIPPLAGVKCDFCKDSRYYQWDAVLRKDEIQRCLKAAGHPVGRIAGLRLLGRGQDGRGATVQVLHDEGQLMLMAKDFRLAVGPGRLRSTHFSSKMAATKFTFQGRGWGHGVGLCQWGAKGMADEGYTAELILGHYYPGAELRKLY